jgi:multiple sugar transport system ATP-binding protein
MRARAQAGSDPGNLVLGIWPEDVEITPGSGDGDLEGQVYAIEPLGDRNVYDVAVGTNLLKIKTPPTFVLNPSVQVSIRFDMTRAHLFDGVTQRALTQFRIHLEECDEQEPRFHPRVGR